MPSFRERERRLAALEAKALPPTQALAPVEIDPLFVWWLLDECLIYYFTCDGAPYWATHIRSFRPDESFAPSRTARVRALDPACTYADLVQLCATLNAQEATDVAILEALSPDAVQAFVATRVRGHGHDPIAWDGPGRARSVCSRPVLALLLARFNVLFSGRIFLPLFPHEPAFIRERVESGEYYVHGIALGASDPNSYRRTHQLSVWGKGVENFKAGSCVARVWTAFLDQEDPNAYGRLTTADLLAWLDEIDCNWGAYTTLPALEEVPDATTLL